jgi:TMEM175 potassium channel family protein
MRTDTGRLEGFSDAVFAIAITLLVLDLKVPPLGEPGLLGKLLLDDWREYLAFLTSFATIGLAWMYHHEFFTLINRVDRALLALNLLLLLGVVIVPFPTAVAVAYARHPDAKVAAMFHTGTFVMIAVIFKLLWWQVSLRNRLLTPGADPQVVNVLNRGSALAPMLYLASFFLATVSVLGSTLLNGAVAVALFMSIPQPGVMRRPA